MDFPAPSVSDADLARAAEANLRGAYAQVGASARQFRDSDALSYFASGAPVPFLNVVTWARFGDNSDEHIEQTLTLFRELHAPVHWWVGPSSTPAHLGERLAAHGLTAFGDVPAMAADLTAEPVRLPAPAGFELRRFEDQSGLRLHLEIVLKVFDVDPALWDPVMEVYQHFGVSPGKGLAYFIGFQDGLPATTAMLIEGGGAAGVYSVATLPEFQGQGLGTLATAAVLDEGRARGYRIAALQSSEMGYRVYQRLGFREVFKFQVYGRAY